MNYIGSKLSLLKFIEESIDQVVKQDVQTFCDLFAGTGAVGRHFKKKGFKVIANDIQYYSYVLNRHYIGTHKPLKFNGLIDQVPKIKTIKVEDRSAALCNYLSGLKGKKGFIYKNYCLGGTTGKKYERQYFSDENGMLCDAVRQKIEEWKNAKYINDDEYYFLITSLVESADKYANTASVYGAFLKKLKRSASKRIIIKPAELIINDQEHQVLNEDVNEVISKIDGDILYLDPPYNQRQYATNYHLLETIAKYDDPVIKGKTGLREYADQKSNYCSTRQVVETFSNLIENSKAKYIFLSYNNEGLMSHSDIEKIMSHKGKYGYFSKDYNRFKADREENREYAANKTVEYLHYVICD